jgi:flagellar basal-body rod protein FlgB
MGDSMNTPGIALFDLADKRLAWVDQRQSLLAQNIANADTPGWRARDLSPFDAAMAQTGVTPVLTDPKHMTGTVATTAGVQTASGERALDGNGVALDEQLSKVADTDATHELVTDLYAKYMGMFRTALDR